MGTLIELVKGRIGCLRKNENCSSILRIRDLSKECSFTSYLYASQTPPYNYSNLERREELNYQTQSRNVWLHLTSQITFFHTAIRDEEFKIVLCVVVECSKPMVSWSEVFLKSWEQIFILKNVKYIILNTTLM